MKIEVSLAKPMPPLWLRYPSLSRYNPTWNTNEEVSYKFDLFEWIDSLPFEDQDKYPDIFYEPKLWKGYYQREDYDLIKTNEYVFCNDNHFVIHWAIDGKPQYSNNDLMRKIQKGMKPEYIFFEGHQPSTNGAITTSCFSRWWKSDFEIDSENYCCMEQYIMAEKARLFGDKIIELQIMDSTDLNEIRELGESVKDFNDKVWNTVKYSIVLTGNFYKFLQNKSLLDFLLSTDNKVLVRGNSYDEVWGVKIQADNSDINNPTKWRGENLLGYALMEVRNELRRICINYHLIDWNNLFCRFN